MKWEPESLIPKTVEQGQLPPQNIEPEIRVSRQVRRRREQLECKTIKTRIHRQNRVDKILRRLGSNWKLKFLTRKDYLALMEGKP